MENLLHAIRIPEKTGLETLKVLELELFLMLF